MKREGKDSVSYWDTHFPPVKDPAGNFSRKIAKVGRGYFLSVKGMLDVSKAIATCLI
jgi:hypothetical protein